MKKLIIMLILLPSLACAAPIVVTCDPQVGVIEYGVSCDGNITLTAPADVDGAMLFDTANWTGAYNVWVNCIAVACAEGAVIDDATLLETGGMVCSDPSSFQLRVPSNQNPKAFKIR